MKCELKHQDLVFLLYIVFIIIALGLPVNQYMSIDIVRVRVQWEGLGRVLAWWGVHQARHSALCYFPLLHSTPHATRWLRITVVASSLLVYVSTHSLASQVHGDPLSAPPLLQSTSGSAASGQDRTCIAVLDFVTKKHQRSSLQQRSTLTSLCQTADINWGVFMRGFSSNSGLLCTSPLWSWVVLVVNTNRQQLCKNSFSFFRNYWCICGLHPVSLLPQFKQISHL